MIEHEQMGKMKEYKEIGLSKEKTRQHLKITGYEINKWWNLDEREFLSKQGESRIKMDRYREFIISHLRVYFFVMVLSYSRMKFVYFSYEPFTTASAIEAHKLAFKYFGGRTQTILYDQDRVFVVSDTLGTIIFVNEFEVQKGYYIRTSQKVRVLWNLMKNYRN